MTSPSEQTGAAPSPQPRDAANWAARGDNLRVSQAPASAINLNVNGRSVEGPLQGFGKMWQKTYRARLTGSDATPRQVISTWKESFPDFWPKGNRFYVPLTGITPGEVALLNLTTGGMPLSTGVLVLYADDESFTLMTPQGHMFAGMITFSASEGGEGEPTTAQADVLMRASDPLYEAALQFGGHRQEDKFWQHTLTALATRFGVQNPTVQTRVVCVDPRRQWRNARNIWNNAAVRTVMLAPFGWIARGQR
ncbi:MAG TPA: hypothetical protein VF808_07945 [Ktedonobacterales bacterium]